MLRAGGNMYMAMMPVEAADYDSPTARLAMRNALHGILYATANSNAMNGLVPGSSVTYEMSPWRKGLLAGSAVACVGAAAIVANMVHKKRSGNAEAADEQTSQDK